MTLKELLDLKAKDENKALELVLAICPNRLRGVDIMNMTVGELRDFIHTEEERRYVKAMAAFNGVHNGDLTISNDGKTNIPDLVEKITQWMWKN